MPLIPEANLTLTLQPEQQPFQIHSRSRRMRDRLLMALGIGLTSAGVAGCGLSNSCPDSFEMKVTLELEDTESSCPTEPDFDNLSIYHSGYHNGEYCGFGTGYYEEEGCSSPELTGQTGTICTYNMSCTGFLCSGYGRPYLDEDGNAVASVSTESRAWSDVVVVNGQLNEAEQEALKAFWLKNAASEHSSVAGFHRFALDLLAHGAPPELIRRAGQAAAQEITHAVDCYSLASAYAGTRLGPKPLALGSKAPVAESLAQLAAWTVRDGVVGETIAAYLAAEALEHATDPEVRRTLEKVVADETAHAELAWETLAWALSVGDQSVMDAVRAVFNAIAYPTTPPRLSTPGTLAHGLLSPQQQDKAARRCIDEVLRPVMASLLSRALAA